MLDWALAQVYDPVMQSVERAIFRRWRRRLLAYAHGDVLEIGAGTGANLEWYRWDRVTSLTLTEPSGPMRDKLSRRLLQCSDLPEISLLGDPSEHLSLPDASVDVAISTLVLCSVDDPARALSELHRVLRPGAQLVFMEHVADDDEEGARWQRRVEPAWKRMAGNCHVTRPTGALIEAAGFTFRWVERERLRGGFPWIRPTVRGVAYRS